MQESDLLKLAYEKWPMLITIGAVAMLFYRQIKAFGKGMKNLIDQLFEWLNQSITYKRNKLDLKRQEILIYQDKFKALRNDALQMTAEIADLKAYISYRDSNPINPLNFENWKDEKA